MTKIRLLFQIHKYFYNFLMVFREKVLTLQSKQSNKRTTMEKIRTFLTTLLIGAIAATAKADNYAYLTVDKQGAETSFEVNSISKITFDATNMILHLTNGTTHEMPLNSLTKMFFSEQEAAGIAAINNDGTSIRMEGGTVKIQAQGGAHITIYNSAGGVVKSLSSSTDNTDVNIGNIPKGIYIIRVNDKAQKVLKR